MTFMEDITEEKADVGNKKLSNELDWEETEIGTEYKFITGK